MITTWKFYRNLKNLRLGDPLKWKIEIFQDLTYSIFKKEKLQQLLDEVAPLENIEMLEITKVNQKVLQKMTHQPQLLKVNFKIYKI